MFYLHIENTNQSIIFSKAKKRISNQSIDISLTEPECDFLEDLCSKKYTGNEVASRLELEMKIWPNSYNVDRSSNLNQVVCTLRKKIDLILNENIILTVPKKGYMLTEIMIVTTEPTSDNLSHKKKTLIDHFKSNIPIYILFIAVLLLIFNDIVEIKLSVNILELDFFISSLFL
ncbi:transcriptional regulator [Photobacterium swingsii]|uniref:winged helix-turn-helix domain-containing protein n=1 Tax=Photobacterium swingsii TaxID=680026 RepID=UPI00352C11A3